MRIRLSITFADLIAYAIILLLTCVLVVPPFSGGYFVSHDLLYHLNWAELFHTQLFEGDLFPRWLFDMKGGRGSPIFYFYCPLPYYVSALFAFIFPAAENTWHALGATYGLALLVSAIGVYRFLKLDTDGNKAIFFTLLYMLFPYHVVVDLYIRFAFTEFFAIAWVPFLFLHTRQLAAGRHRAAWWLALFYALLVLSHIPTSLIFTPIIVLYYYVCRKKTGQRFGVITSLCLGAGLAAFYVLPVMALKDAAAIDKLMVGHGYYENAFLLSGNPLDMHRPKFWTFLNNLSLVSLVLAISAFLSHRKPAKRTVFFTVMTLLCIAMMFPVSRPAWNLVPVLMVVQFPWRFFIAISFTLFFLAATAKDVRQTWLTKYAYAFTLISMFALATLTCYYAFDKATGQIDAEHAETIRKSRFIREGIDGYLPPEAPDRLVQQVNSMSIERINALFIGTKQPVEQVVMIKGGQIRATLKTSSTQTIRLQQFYFPTWQANLDTSGSPITLRKTADGFIEFTLTEGLHKIVFTHKRSRAEDIGGIISLLSLAFLLLRLAGQARVRPESGPTG